MGVEQVDRREESNVPAAAGRTLFCCIVQFRIRVRPSLTRDGEACKMRATLVAHRLTSVKISSTICHVKWRFLVAVARMMLAFARMRLSPDGASSLTD